VNVYDPFLDAGEYGSDERAVWEEKVAWALYGERWRERADVERKAKKEAAEPPVVERCARCGGDAGDNHFDRSLCACDAMHTCCNGCGYPLDGCPFEDEALD
jgi:hypothetical protein